MSGPREVWADGSDVRIIGHKAGTHPGTDYHVLEFNNQAGGSFRIECSEEDVFRIFGVIEDFHNEVCE
jgi:hypothetical protein